MQTVRHRSACRLRLLWQGKHSRDHHGNRGRGSASGAEGRAVNGRGSQSGVKPEIPVGRRPTHPQGNREREREREGKGRRRRDTQTERLDGNIEIP